LQHRHRGLTRLHRLAAALQSGQGVDVTSAPAPSALLRPLLLGVLTGSRSQLGLAALALAAAAIRRR
jgi:hypothetical protein